MRLELLRRRSENRDGRYKLKVGVRQTQWEREAIGERTATALRHLRDNRKVYNHTPLGFRREGKLLVEDSLELSMARRIVRLHQEGRSMNQIAVTLNKSNVPTKLGGRWHASTVKRVLDRAEVYR